MKKLPPTFFSSTLVTVGLAISQTIASAAINPITVTGFNRDVVIENTASGPSYTNAAMNFNAGENTTFYQTNLSGKAHGLPLTGAIVSTNEAALFQLQPYNASNALVMSSDTGATSGVLFLTTPRIYDRIAIIANSGNGSSTSSGTLTFRFSDGSTYVTNYYAPDWFNNANAALYSIAALGFERIDLTTGTVSGSPNNPRLYQTTIALTNVPNATNKLISALVFDKANANSVGIYAVSGQTNAFQTNVIFTAAVLTNLAATSLTTTGAVVSGQVFSNGNDAPVVTLFFGPVNGGTNPNAWSNSLALGWQTGSFSQSLTTLLASTTYFFTTRAVNAGGTSWGTPVQNFTTATPTLATITNLPAGGVRADSASLYGQVLSTGGDAPNVTIFWGPFNGGNNPSAWSNSIPIGLQSSIYGRGIFGLSNSTTYFFNARAVNGAGTSWGATAQFTTLASNPVGPNVAVMMQHNDVSRTGGNLNETALNLGNVNTNSFGLLYSRVVDDQIYAQPLVLTNVNIPGQGVHNILIVCTVNNSVYAFDADNAAVTSPYWQTSYTNANAVAPANTDMTGACGGAYKDFSGKMGIVGTPAIDPVAGTMYFVVRTKEFGSTYVQYLHAVDITTGAERIGSPVIIAASVAGTGSGSVGGVVSFDSQKNNQRSALVLVNGVVYIGWSSHCDWGPYHGWIMGYNASTLVQEVAFCDTANGSNGGIWMSGQGPAVDPSGNLYISTGNGSVGTASDRSDLTNRGESFLRLTRSGANLNITSFFTPYNWSTLEGGDIDLGSAGILLIPGTTRAFSGGKEGKVYLVNRDAMGGLSGSATADTNIYQSFQVTSPTGQNDIHGAPVWWDGPDGSYAYIQGESDYVRQYKFDRNTGLFVLPQYARSALPAWIGGMPGGISSISANGTNAGTGILWVSHQYSGDANQAVRPGILRAYDAQNITNELWNTQLVPARDAVGQFAKYVPPTVVNGKVYLATFSGRLNVYGVLPPGSPRIYQQPQTTARYSGESFVLSVGADGAVPLTYQWWKGASPIPGATTASLNFINAQFTNSGTYTMRITNVSGFAISSNATLTVLQTPTITYAQMVVADNPVGYWRLGETSGTIARDSVGGHDGEYINTVQGLPGYNNNDTDTAVQVGVLTNSDSYVGNINGIDFMTMTNNGTFTVEAWVNGPSAQVNGAGIVTYGYGSGGEQFNLDTGNGGRFRFSVRDFNNLARNANGTIFPSNTWQHVVGVCDEPNNIARLYVNGAQVATAAISAGIQLGTSPISIGSRQANFSSTYNMNFVGRIDEVAIYNYALSPAQVLNHYMTGTNPVVIVYLQPSPGNVILSWSPGLLQSATNVSGPYSDIPSATSPYTLPASEQQRYFRVRVR